MTQNKIINEYFEWLSDKVCVDDYYKKSYRKLLTFLHNTDFRCTIQQDENRAEDGMDLRWLFATEFGYEYLWDALIGPCSVLEMMIALAMEMERIMDDPDIGDRTSEWFWTMIDSLGLIDMTDDIFDKTYTSRTIERFLDRQYRRNGVGGLFIINDCDEDLNDVEIWYQMCWYLNTLIDFSL